MTIFPAGPNPSSRSDGHALESKPACSSSWDTADVDRELRPRFGISTYRIGRLDIQQQISEIAEVERSCS